MTVTTKLTRPVLLAGCLLLLWYVGFDTADAQSTRTRLEAEGQYTDGGTELCLSCHGGETMTIMAETPHGNLDNPHTPYSQRGCESCHGPGSVHVSRAGGGIGFPLLLSFENKVKFAVPKENAACMKCHAEALGSQDALTWTGSPHDDAGTSCQDCHDSHTTEDPMTGPRQNAACMKCHAKAQGGLDALTWTGSPHEVIGMSCQDCHDAHSTKDPMAVQGVQLEHCAGCHLEEIEMHREVELPVDTYSCSEGHEVHEP